MVEVNLQEIDADFYAANCHKWIMAPAGAAFLQVRATRKVQTKPLVISWGMDYPPEKQEADSGAGGSCWQWNLEFHGTADRCAQMVLPETIAFRKTLGGEEQIQLRMRDTSHYLREKLAALGYAAATPTHRQLSGGGLTAFEFPCADVLAWRDWIWQKHRIECPVTTGGGRTFLRVSTGWFTTRDQIDALAAALVDHRANPARSK